MRLSIWPGAGQSYAAVLEQARHAEETGWDGVWFADHFMPNVGPGEDDTGPVLECGSVVAALAAAVPRVRIGTLVYGITYRHPAVLANMAATVDQISDGRFVLGVGAGWQLNEHEQYGIELGSLKVRIDRFEEALRILDGLLRTPRTTVHGDHYRVTGAVNEPKPVQQPLPLMIGAKGEKRMLRIVAERADEWNCWGRPEFVAHKSAVLDQHCADLGRDPKTIARTGQALTVVDGPLPADAPHVIGGSPAKLADDIAAYAGNGLDELIVPDALLGEGAARLKAMDAIRSIVSDL
ncbi:TIGR03560 family F420-dependent LLM class oxidoreductase [Paractinoplanes lichenicola]|uniref:TIGR03560 family F420-dependent LLM class oxidoreductase n=1 Tax=Paractinoplanes lichenicola TaxID=2802976 RepID=A0ABS1VME8_9ACTN|nr:TIGR03560 family F420-dependent LLM class oxidoreductase [Actinoplanes lichenicola]MBL7255390.1 TIGR03560 family F420-dependent LLM class oxidoreductase [Actinoplanes lichenicola]